MLLLANSPKRLKKCPLKSSFSPGVRIIHPTLGGPSSLLRKRNRERQWQRDRKGHGKGTAKVTGPQRSREPLTALFPVLKRNRDRNWNRNGNGKHCQHFSTQRCEIVPPSANSTTVGCKREQAGIVFRPSSVFPRNQIMSVWSGAFSPGLTAASGERQC